MLHFWTSLILTVVGFVLIAVLIKNFMVSIYISSVSVLGLGMSKELFDLLIQGQSLNDTLVDMKYNLLGIGIVVVVTTVLYFNRRG